MKSFFNISILLVLTIVIVYIQGGNTFLFSREY